MYKLIFIILSFFIFLWSQTEIQAASLSANYTASPPLAWGQGVTKTYNVTVTNTGQDTWNAGGVNPVKLGVHFGKASDGWGTDWATDQRFNLPNDLAPGQSATLSVSVTAPVTLDSYILRHRMVKTAVAWFDQIKKDDVIMCNNPPPPTGITPSGYTTSGSKTFTWNNMGDPNWYYFRISNTINGCYDCGAAFSGTSHATNINAGTVNSIWMHSVGRDNTGNVNGSCWSNASAVTLTSPSASYTVSPPLTWGKGETKTYNVTVTNNGQDTWNANGNNKVRLGIHFGKASDGWGTDWAPGTDKRFNLPNDLAPGQSATLSVSVTAPATTGSYVLRHRMLKEAVMWYDQIKKDNATVIVLPADPPAITITPSSFCLSCVSIDPDTGLQTSLNKTLISWINPASPVSSVNISENSSFTPYFAKIVSGTSTNAPDGFTYYGTGWPATPYLLVKPGTTYYVRLYNGSLSATSSFSIPYCAASAICVQ